ncbi:hypothetical protein HHI36_003334 [Cryptolaemus montrouzieri]|uniref:Uncharacterized protein n=1 Tax=Cryptolaemus montrouzieri TaxID=559131 RepID=A0ABD2PD27_9CUCU
MGYSLKTGIPDCGSRQIWPIYFNKNSSEKLQLLPNGVLRHIYSHPIPNEEDDIGVEIIEGKDVLFHDFPQGQYCMDKSTGNMEFLTSIACSRIYSTEKLYVSPWAIHSILCNVVSYGHVG